MSSKEIKQVLLTDVCVTPQIKKAVKRLEARHPEVRGLLIYSGKLTKVGKAMYQMQCEQDASFQYNQHLQQGGLGVSW